jgi:hypothetical protein
MMSSAVFTTGNEAYHVANIVYAGPVAEIPAERRRNGSTHSFKVTTTVGTNYCYYKDAEAARKARGALTGMLDAVKTTAFRHGNEFVDPKNVVSFGNVLQFKKPQDDLTHAFVITLQTADEKNRELWMRYKSEDHARKGRRALWAVVHAVNGLSKPKDDADDKSPVKEVAEESVPF